MVYGSCIGVAAVVLVVAVGARTLDVISVDELRQRAQQQNGPQRLEAFREWLPFTRDRAR